jgi:tetraacyldisaccharide 4'-kinase
MNFKKPNFWDLSRPKLISYLLIPLSFPIIIRNFIFQLLKKEKQSIIKTICVGNIYLGGTGKTPLTIKLYEILTKLNFKVATIKKDYSNQKDEQLLLKKKTNLITVSSRKLAIQKGLNQCLDYLIFDDGLQEMRIEYNISFVCFKSKNWIGNGQLIPAGPMREKISSLKRFDAVFLNGFSNNLDKIENQIYKINSKIKIFRTLYKISNIDNFNLNLEYLIFSGIGNPSDFREILLEKKFIIKKEKIFPDHHEYTHNDYRNILDDARKDNLKILTTEKDFMKIPEEFKNKIEFISIDINIKNENDLIQLLKK